MNVFFLSPTAYNGCQLLIPLPMSGRCCVQFSLAANLTYPNYHTCVAKNINSFYELIDIKCTINPTDKYAKKRIYYVVIGRAIK